MVPSEFQSFFIASSGASAALVGLLFVAVSLSPERNVSRRAPVERQAVAGGAFTALINAFFVSLVALVPHLGYGTLTIPFSALSLVATIPQAWVLLRLRKGWKSLLRRLFLILTAFGLYGYELSNGVGLIRDPGQVGFIYAMIFLLIGLFGLGLTRAWQLLGAHRYGLGGWLNPLQDIRDEASREESARR